jgi:RNA polymerase sigma-70 factor (family 1)
MQVEASADKEQLIIELLKQGNEHAFNSIFRNYGKRLYHFSYGYLKSREHAEEIVQETFMKIWEVRASIDSELSFSAFIFTISYRLILNRLRKLRHERSRNMQWERKHIRVGNETEEAFFADDLDRLARIAITGLPPKRKAIFHMVRNEHMSYQQVAERLQISVKTVEAQMREALKYLRKKVII